MKLIIAGVAAVAVAGGAYMAFSGNSAPDNTGDGAGAASNTASNNGDDGGAGSTANQNVAANTAPGSNSAPNQSSSGQPRLHPVRKVCIDYVMSGPMMSGTSTKCHRKFAFEQYAIEHTEIGFGGITQSQDQHTITIGEIIYAIDVDAGTGMQTVNPMYAGIVSALENTSAEDMSAAFLASSGFSPTSEIKTIAETECIVHTSAQLGSACFTPDGLLLEQSIMGTTQTAVSVDIGNGGANDNYTLYQNVNITEGPDLSDGIQGLMNQMGENN